MLSLPDKSRVRFDLANYAEQRYGDTAITSYTLLVSTSASGGVSVVSYNESRVMVKFAEGWKIVHVHKSPSYKSPLAPALAPARLRGMKSAPEETTCPTIHPAPTCPIP